MNLTGILLEESIALSNWPENAFIYRSSITSSISPSPGSSNEPSLPPANDTPSNLSIATTPSPSVTIFNLGCLVLSLATPNIGSNNLRVGAVPSIPVNKE